MKQQIKTIHSVEVQNFRSDPSSGKWACQACTYYNYPKVCLNVIIFILIIIVIVTTIMMALAQIPIGTFSHVWVFVRQYGIMFVIIVITIIIVIIIIIYRKVKVSTL